MKGGGKTIKAKDKKDNIFTFVSQGGWCSTGAGCPEGVLLYRWCQGHGVMWSECYVHGSSWYRPHIMQPGVE